MATYLGVDFHARQQTLAWCDTRDGEVHEHQLSHLSTDLVRRFYSRFTGEVIVGLEASGYSAWFEAMLQELGHQVWVGDAFAIRRRARSRQKTDRRDAQLLLDLLIKGEFPRIHRLAPESLEVLRQLRYRHRLVQMRTRVHHALQTMALGAGTSLKSKLRTKAGKVRLDEIGLTPALGRQRQDWLEAV
jgi:transposase